VFWINLPLAGLAILLALWLVPLKGVDGDIKKKLLNIDYFGSALVVGAAILLFVRAIINPVHLSNLTHSQLGINWFGSLITAMTRH